MAVKLALGEISKDVKEKIDNDWKSGKIKEIMKEIRKGLKKMDRTDEHGNLIGHKNGLYLNKEMANKEKWTAKDIEERTKKIVKETLKLFKVEGEIVGDLNITCL